MRNRETSTLELTDFDLASIAPLIEAKANIDAAALLDVTIDGSVQLRDEEITATIDVVRTRAPSDPSKVLLGLVWGINLRRPRSFPEM